MPVGVQLTCLPYFMQASKVSACAGAQQSVAVCLATQAEELAAGGHARHRRRADDDADRGANLRHNGYSRYGGPGLRARGRPALLKQARWSWQGQRAGPGSDGQARTIMRG